MKPSAYTIFYADDDVDDQDFFKEIVSEIGGGHRVYTHDHGMALLEELDNPPPAPDVIFLDLNMPEKNGHQVLEEIRQSPKYKHLPVIILSTSDDEGQINKSKKLGANLYICKPNSYPLFRKMLSSVLAMDWQNKPAGETDFLYRNPIA